MEKRNTKQEILMCALDLFSKRGYEGVPVRDIARAVGIKESSLYKHYHNKRDIFDSILREADAHYQKAERALRLDGSPQEKAGFYAAISEENLTASCLGLFNFLLHDAFTAKCRKMLTIEQYKSPEAAALYNQSFFRSPLNYQRELFRQLIAVGVVRKGADPKTMALQFYAPVHFLLCRCDATPGMEDEAHAAIRKHITAFRQSYLKEAFQ